MNNDIQKLTNVKFTVTTEVITRKWQEVESKRNGLLAASDWTQLIDTDLPQASRGTWIKWRKKIREISKKNVANPDKAMALLTSLEKQIPKKLNIAPTPELPIEGLLPAKVVIGEDSITEIKEYVDKLFTDKVIPKLITYEDMTTVISENILEAIQQASINLQALVEKKIANVKSKPIQLSDSLDDAKLEIKHIINKTCNAQFPTQNQLLYDEALDYAVDPSTKVGMLNIYASYYNKSLTDTATFIIESKKESYKISCAIEENRLKYFGKVDQAISVDDLQIILNEFMNGY